MTHKHPNRLLLEEQICKSITEMPDGQFVVLEKLLNDLKHLRTVIAERGEGPGDVAWNGCHSIIREANEVIKLHKEEGSKVDGFDVLHHSSNMVAYSALISETMIYQVDYDNHPRFGNEKPEVFAALCSKGGEA